MVGAKSSFWQALIFTILIFAFGIMVGVKIEDSWVSKSNLAVTNSEIELIDQQIVGRVVTDFNLSCIDSKKVLFDFADKVYSEALELESYSSASKFSSEQLSLIHRRYDLLRLGILSDASSLNRVCNLSFFPVVYVFDYATEDISLKAKQLTFEKVLEELKTKNPDNILLIPIAANLDLYSVEVFLKGHNVKEAPAILVDGKVLSEITDIRDLENIVFESNKQ